MNQQFKSLGRLVSHCASSEVAVAFFMQHPLHLTKITYPQEVK